ncbi:MAG: DUF5362 domain-containing protein [Thermotogae bacterium]|nr:DUF5362 domain-containing protein [Thermotogota bacterium]
MQLDLQRLRGSIKGTGWAKFLAVMSYFYGGIAILGCVTIPLGIFYIIIGMKLWSLASRLEQLKYQDDPDLLYAALDDLGSMLTWYGIFVVVSIALSAILLVVYFAILFPNLSTMYSL